MSPRYRFFGRIGVMRFFSGHNAVTVLCLRLAPSVLDGSVERADVTDLYSWMEYQFRIIATNEYGSGEASIPSLKIKTWDSGEERFDRQV